MMPNGGPGGHAEQQRRQAQAAFAQQLRIDQATALFDAASPADPDTTPADPWPDNPEGGINPWDPSRPLPAINWPVASPEERAAGLDAINEFLTWACTVYDMPVAMSLGCWREHPDLVVRWWALLDAYRASIDPRAPTGSRIIFEQHLAYLTQLYDGKTIRCSPTALHHRRTDHGDAAWRSEMTSQAGSPTPRWTWPAYQP
ncbi:MAG: hypothetical protein FWD59_01345 [Micrococcales bacterium]|nr:hypothetical protein [Micrococcales bacterium]